MLVVAMVGVLLLTVTTDAVVMANHHRELAGHADDLRAAAEQVDLLARETRCAAALVGRTPDGAVRLGAGALVTRANDGGTLALSVEPGAAGHRARLVRRRYDAAGALRLKEDLGPVGALTLRFDGARASEVSAVTIDLALPSRTGAAPPPTLSTRALVGGEVTR
jgi:hypothetical protein